MFVLVEQYVARLNIAVKNAMRVQILQSLENLSQYRTKVVLRQGVVHGFVVFNELNEVLIAQLGHKVDAPVFARKLDVNETDDILVSKRM